MATDSPGRIASSPPKGVPIEEELSYWKTQYEQVELELQEFQNSSKELEAELERDIEESDKRERTLREKAEQLNFEVDEWKVRRSCVAATADLKV
jgi:predicted  nucleic acid-binding Zn-ribbon protein